MTTRRIANARLHDSVRQVVGYVRVSTGDQAESGAGLEAQRQAIRVACEQRGWRLAELFEDAGASGKSLNRPGVQAAIAAVEAGEANGLVVAKLDRLSRSLIDFAAVVERSQRKDWVLVALDLGVDTSTPQGELLASVMVTFAVYERRLIGIRTKDALAVKRSQGIRLGRRPSIPDRVIDELTSMRQKGLSYRAIAALLNETAVLTGQGGRWHPGTVREALRSRGLLGPRSG